MSNVVRFRLRCSATRQQALNWLRSSISRFPNNPGHNGIGEDLFHGWRFIAGLDGHVYFANCVEPGITESELYEHLGDTAA